MNTSRCYHYCHRSQTLPANPKPDEFKSITDIYGIMTIDYDYRRMCSCRRAQITSFAERSSGQGTGHRYIHHIVQVDKRDTRALHQCVWVHRGLVGAVITWGAFAGS
jgi:hypothetical protein